jgi:hypothetical protein
MKGKVTPKNLEKVILKLLDYLKGDDPVGRLMFCRSFDKFLDELVSNDFFGTEAQCDPRGDQRD